MADLRIFPTSAALAEGAAGEFLRICDQTIDRQGRCRLLLAGGSTPRSMYSLLASRNRSWSGWSRLQVCWGDERCVPPDHADSNYRMAYESLLAHVPVTTHQIFRMPGELLPSLGSMRYEKTLSDLFGGKNMPEFDLALLGVGEDGHIASLFPGSLALEERQRWVVDVLHDQPPPPLVPRLSVTLPVINAARHVLLLVAGENKAAILTQVFLAQVENSSLMPVQRVRPSSGLLTWMVDAAAAKSLPG